MHQKEQPAGLPQLTGLRGLAAFLVLFGHLKTPEGVMLNFGVADPFSQYGGFGVDIFFVLSGFILCHVYADRLLAERGVLRDFYTARFARIYPLHIVTLLLMLGAYVVSLRVGVRPTESTGYTLWSTVLSLLLVSEWFGSVAPNPGSWSISVEFANYLLFPVITVLLAASRKWSPVIIALCAIMLALRSDDWRLMRGMDEFVMGCAAHYCAREFRFDRLAALSGLLFVVPFLVPAYGGHIEYWQVAFCFTLMVLLLASGSLRDPFNRFCASRPLVFLGEISYSVYLLQWFIWIGWKHVLAKMPFFAAHLYLMVLGAAASVILVSAISYSAFERPARIWLRSRFAPRAGSFATEDPPLATGPV